MKAERRSSGAGAAIINAYCFECKDFTYQVKYRSLYHLGTRHSVCVDCDTRIVTLTSYCAGEREDEWEDEEDEDEGG